MRGGGGWVNLYTILHYSLKLASEFAVVTKNKFKCSCPSRRRQFRVARRARLHKNEAV